MRGGDNKRQNNSNYPEPIITPVKITILCLIYFMFSVTEKKNGFGDYLNVYIIFPNKLGVKDITDTQNCASYIDNHLEIYNERQKVMTSLFQW